MCIVMKWNLVQVDLDWNNNNNNNRAKLNFPTKYAFPLDKSANVMNKV